MSTVSNVKSTKYFIFPAFFSILFFKSNINFITFFTFNFIRSPKILIIIDEIQVKNRTKMNEQAIVLLMYPLENHLHHLLHYVTVHFLFLQLLRLHILYIMVWYYNQTWKKKNKEKTIKNLYTLMGHWILILLTQ